MGRFAKGDISGLDVRERFSLGSLARVTGIIVGAKLRGDARRSPFFDAANGEPVAAPNVLSEEELRRIEPARDRYATSSGRTARRSPSRFLTRIRRRPRCLTLAAAAR